MQARRAARELALILFSQFDKKITQYNQTEFEDIILKSVRTLTNNAIDELKVSVGAINAMIHTKQKAPKTLNARCMPTMCLCPCL